MKTTLRYCLLTFFLLIFSSGGYAQTSFLTISGVVSDEREELAYVSVHIKGSTLATITNEDGYFSLKIPAVDKEIALVFSHVGYHSKQMYVRTTEAQDLKIKLTPYYPVLTEAYIVDHDPENLVRAALQKVRDNYPSKPIMQRGFYRETARKGNRYISVSEAVVDMFKRGYNHDSDFDRVRVLKGRRLMSQKSADTLSVKMQGGPNLTLSLDVVKNHEDLFYLEDLENYSYDMKMPTAIDGREVHVVTMSPKTRNEQYPLYNAVVYIDKASLAIMRVEYSVDMYDKDLVTNNMLMRKPMGIIFDPQAVEFIASYRLVGDVAVLQYVRSSMRFRCDWRKRLFSSSYTVVAEMVATDVEMDDVEPFTVRDAFRNRDIFYDRVNDFADPDFWGDYNILEPSESLEHAVARLRRRVSR